MSKVPSTLAHRINLNETLGKRRISLAVAVGIVFSLVLLIRELNKETFKQVEPGEGTHAWVDGNGNGKVDVDESEDFQLDRVNGDYRLANFADALEEVHWTALSVVCLLGALLMMALRDIAYMYRIRVLTDYELTWGRSLYVILIWEFASALSPGVVGGAAVAMFILNREGIAMGRSTAITVITALMDNLFFIIAVPIVLLISNAEALFPQGGSGFFTQNVQTLFWLGYAVMFLVCTILFLSIFVWPRLIKFIILGFTKLPFLRKWRAKGFETANEVELTSKELRGKPAAFWLRSFGATIVSWTARYLVINLVVLAFIHSGVREQLLLFGRQFVMWLIMLVSPTPGASGVAEMAFSGLLGDVVGNGMLLAGLAFIWRVISYYPYLFIGSVLLPKWLRQTKKHKKKGHKDEDADVEGSSLDGAVA